MTFPTSVRSLFIALAALFLVAGCGDSDPVSPPIPSGEATAVVVNSVELTLTVFSLDDPSDRRTVALGPEGTPVGGAVRGNLAAIPLGIVPAVAVVDLATGDLLRTPALPAGSGATGAHFVNDSIVLVANPGLNSVSPVNVLSGTVGPSIETGGYPQGFVEASGVIFVINSELGGDFNPDGNGTLTALSRETLDVLGTVQLSGENSGSAAVGPGGAVLVMNAGRWGEESATLSVVDPSTRTETAHHTGFGDFPGAVAVTDDGRLLASSWSFGILEWDLATGTFTRSPADAAAPGGVPSSSGVAVDPEGAVWSLFPDCQNASKVLRLNHDLEVEDEVTVGVCPAAILFTTF